MNKKKIKFEVIRKGDRVTRDEILFKIPKEEIGKVYIASCDEYKLSNGQRVVQLEGKSGHFLVEGLNKIYES